MEQAVESKLTELISALNSSELISEMKRAREAVDSNETNKTLVREYESAQIKLQRAALSGGEADACDMERFQRLAGLLMMSCDTQKYIITSMRVQQTLAEIIGKLSQSVGLDLSAFMNNLG